MSDLPSTHPIRSALIIAAGILASTALARFGGADLWSALLACGLLLASMLLSQELEFRSSGNRRRHLQSLILPAATALAVAIVALSKPASLASLLPILGASAWLASLPMPDGELGHREAGRC